MHSKKMNSIIEELKESPIDGCITGSCMLPHVNFDLWEELPDIDIFVYGEVRYMHAITWLLDHGFEFGNVKDSKKTPMIEEWKFNKFLEDGADFKHDVTTIYFQKDGVSVNVSLKYKKDCEGKRYCTSNVIDVLSSFDMNLTMIGYDIKHKKLFDVRTITGGSVNVAVPNPLKKWDVNPWRLQTWLRQWNRVIKYWNRGFDTRPMARFYLEKIEEVLALPNLFPASNDEEKSAWDLAIEGLPEMREDIIMWLKEKED